MMMQDKPDYMIDWDFEENTARGLDPSQISVCSRKRVYWKCHTCGGKWDTVAKERRGCPYCNNFKALPGYNDLATLFPNLAVEWAYDLNGDLFPSNVTRGSQKKVMWRCEKGHTWDAQINSRVAGQGCPYCNNRRVLKGYNDLATVEPEIAAEWHPTKNGDLRPENIISGSKQYAWWKCGVCGYEWRTAIGNRKRGNGCPSCAHVVLVSGKNDVETNYPMLAREWDYSRNILKPSEVACHSRKRIAWICPRGHEYTAVVSDRVKGTGCPICSQERRVSFPEKAVLYYLKKSFDRVESNYHTDWLGKFELDVFLPDYSIGIEYDGVYGHSNKTHVARDNRKNAVCRHNGVTLIRIREHGCPPTDLDASSEYIMEENDKIEDMIPIVFRFINGITGRTFEIPSVDIDQDQNDIYALIEFSDKENSLQNAAPDVAKLWHPTKNKKLTPDNVSCKSSKVVWWLGPCGHEWKSPVAYEGQSGLCPYCSNKRVLRGFNDLVTANPALASEWDAERNGTKRPEDYVAGAHNRVWWKCAKGHSWQASITSRNQGRGCPICTNRVVLQGYNDVASFPKLLIDWDYEKNSLQPEMVCIGSQKSYFWKCHVCGHRWSAGVDDRYRGSMCPECAKKQRSKTVSRTYVERSGSLEQKRPDLMDEWDYKLNIELDPAGVTPGCTKKAYWVCKTCGHHWEASICSRTRKVGGGCPNCANKAREEKRRLLRIQKSNPLSITHPAIAAFWDYDRNEGLNPELVSAGSGRKIWWKCPSCDYSWQAAIVDRCRRKGSCPKCKKIPGQETENDI